MSVETEIEEFWKRYLQKSGNREEHGYYFDFKNDLEEIHSKAAEESNKFLQPWLSILELEIQWLALVNTALNDNLEASRGELVATWVLTGVACAHAVAIRKLCLCGLDTSARIILRSLIETLDICILTTFDAESRIKFIRAHEPNEAEKTWRNFLSGKNLERSYAGGYHRFCVNGHHSDNPKEGE